MRPSSVVFLLLLSLLLSDAHGIRLNKGIGSVWQHTQNDEKTALISKDSGGNGEESFLSCKDGQCSGKNRKLVTAITSTTTTMSKVQNVKNGGNQAGKGNSSEEKLRGEQKNLKVNSSATSKHGEVPGHHEEYPDLGDITEMDYSPARRKPPIHN